MKFPSSNDAAPAAIEQQLRESEERFQALARHAPVGIYLWSASRGCYYVNPRWEEMTGVSAAEATGTGWVVAIHPDDQAAVFEAWNQTAGQGREFTLTYRMRHRNGGVAHVMGQAAPFSPPGATEPAFVGTVTDISEQKRLEEELRASRNAAESADRAKSAFMANVSHEIRTPMNAILGFSALLAEEIKDPQQRELLAVIGNNGRSLLELIDQILDLSNLEAGRLELAHVDFSLTEVVEEAVVATRPRAEEKGLEMQLVVPADLEDRRQGDRGRLRQVLINLLSNAVKFTETGRITLEVGGLAPGRSMSQLVFKVSDTGVGIPDEARAELFRPFMQVDPSSTRRFGGTGLGLSICRGLVEKMKGRIWLESEPGSGTTVFVLVPLAVAEAATAAIDPELPGKLPPALRVIVADGDANERRRLDAQLRRLGVTVETVATGPELLSRLSLLAFDAALIAMDLPGLPGREALRQIRGSENFRTPARVPVIGLGAEDADPTGFTGFLPAASTLEETAVELGRAIGSNRT